MAKRGRPRKFQDEGEKSARSIPTKTVENLADQPEKSNIKEYSLDDFISEKIEKSSQEIQENRLILTIPEIISQENSENKGINITENQINIEKIDNQISFVFSILNFFLAKNNIEVLDDNERQELLLSLMQFDFFRLIIIRYMKYLVIAKVLGVRAIKLLFKKSEDNPEVQR